MSAECEKHGVDLHGDTVSGLVCPVCEKETETERFRQALVLIHGATLGHDDLEQTIHRVAGQALHPAEVAR